MNAQQRQVRDLMSTDVVTVRRNDKLAVVDDLMKQDRIRHMPVLDENGDLCGIVTQRDLFRGALLKALGFGTRAEERMLDSVTVKEAMIEAVQTTAPDTPLTEAAGQMMTNKIGCLPVVENGKLVGILTEGDFLKLVVEGKSQ